MENADKFGWWHVSCSYAFQDKAKGTLFNSKINQEIEVPLSGVSFYYPQSGLFVQIAKSLVDQDSAEHLLVKEIRFWSSMRSNGEIANYRYRQVDPLFEASDSLVAYYRLATGSSHVNNLAAFKFTDGYRDANLRTEKLRFAEDFIEEVKYIYDAQEGAVVQQNIRTYHTVCPAYTYFMGQSCYNEPINKALITALPLWDESTDTLNWQLSLKFSSAISSEIMAFLDDTWTTDDIILNDYLASVASDSHMEYVIPDRILRHEAQYRIKADISNEEITFH